MKSLQDYTIVIRPDDNGTFVAYVPAIPGCHAWGQTADEARTELANVFDMMREEYSQIFARAGAIVHQGGIGTTAQALQAGRPTLVMPYSHDQPDNAARVARLGTSLTIPRKQYAAARVAKMLRELLENPCYAAKAAAIGQIIQSENGVAVACDAIEQQLQVASVSP